MDAVAAWMSELQAHSERYRQRAETMYAVLATVGAGAWSGLAADAFRARLRVVADATSVASTRHGEAGAAARGWAQAMFDAQYVVDRALVSAEEAEHDIAVAQAAVTALTGDHLTLLDAVATLERASSVSRTPAGAELFAARQRAEEVNMTLIRSRRSLEDAEECLEDARAKARDAKQEYEHAAAQFVRLLEAATNGAIARAATAELNDFTSGVVKLSTIDASGRPGGVALMTVLQRLTVSELTLLLAGDPGLLQRFWDTPPNPEVVAGWWNGLTPDARTALLEAAPGLVGNLPGIPFTDRDTANRISLELAQNNPDLTPDRQAVLTKMAQALKEPADEVPVQLVAFNFFTEPPMVAVGYGDLDTCENTTWCVAGMDSGARDALGGWTDAAKNLYLTQHDLGINRPGVVACLEYDNPDVFGVVDSDAAKKGAPRFAAELDGNAATREVFGPGPVPIAVTAHSYGTTMASIALTLTRTPVDAFVLVASAGIDTSLVPSLSALHADHVYTTAATPDQLAPVGAAISGRAEPNPEVAYGTNYAIGGAEAFSSDGDGKALEPVDGHNAIGEKGNTGNSGPLTLNAVPSEGHGYYDRDTQSLYNIAATTTGQPGTVSGGLTDTTPGADQHNIIASFFAGASLAPRG
ncbi:alpha/beta hydrolase [Leifsonia lichenia]